MTNELNAVQFGKLLSTVETLEKSVERLEQKIELQTNQIDDIKNNMASGKGLFLGICLASAGLGAGASKFVEHLLS